MTLRVVRPSISVADVTVTEGDAGTQDLTFTLQLSEPSAATVSVPWQTADGTTNPATAPSDYTAGSGTVTWSHLDPLAKSIVVKIKGDTIYEYDETFLSSLAPATNATLDAATATGTITDNDLPPAVSISADAPAVLEGDGPATTPAAFTVALSAVSGVPFTVDYATQDGTATAGSDYTASSATLVFAAGEASKAVTIAVLGDKVNEPNKQFSVKLTDSTDGVTVGTAMASQTITDDDPLVSVSPASVNEGNTGRPSWRSRCRSPRPRPGRAP